MIFVLLAAVAGLLIGSFLNVCVFRLPRDLSVMDPARSFCPECEETIVWYDNVPVLSFLLLKGRCRSCHARIPFRYLLVELATAAVFAFAVVKFEWSPMALKYALFSAILITLTASDFEERILPDEFTLGGTALGLLLAYFVPMEPMFAMMAPAAWGPRWQSVVEAVLGIVLSAGAIWLVAYLYEKFRHREGMGLGDVKMIGMVGAFLGLRGALGSLILASLAGSVLGVLYIKIKKEDMSSYELPFGSFIGVAAWVFATFLVK